MNPTFINPYSLDAMADSGEDQHKTTVYLGGRDLGFLRGLNTNNGIIQITVGILVKKLVNALKENNITSYDPAEFERAVTGLNIILPAKPLGDGAVGGPAALIGRVERPVHPIGNADRTAPDHRAETIGRDERPGTGGVARQPEQAPVQPANVPSTPAGKRASSRGGKGTQGKKGTGAGPGHVGV